MNDWLLYTSIAALIGAATIGGVFFAFSTFIMAALQRIPSAAGMQAMQSINRVVLNPAFLGVFIGTAILSLALLLMTALADSGSGLTHWHFVGALHYIAGTFMVTGLGNVPLNNRLAAASADEESGHAVWKIYLVRWTLLNHVRTAAALIAAFCFTMGIARE